MPTATLARKRVPTMKSLNVKPLKKGKQKPKGRKKTNKVDTTLPRVQGDFLDLAAATTLDLFRLRDEDWKYDHEDFEDWLTRRCHMPFVRIDLRTEKREILAPLAQVLLEQEVAAEIEKALEFRSKASERLQNQVTQNLRELADTLKAVEPEKNYALEYKIGERWYPVLANIEYFKGFTKEYVYIDLNLVVPGQAIDVWKTLGSENLNPNDHPSGRKVDDVLAEVGLRLRQTDLVEWQRKLDRFQRVSQGENGKLVRVETQVLELQEGFWGMRRLTSVLCGTPRRAQKAIIENALEIGQVPDRRVRQSYSTLPLVRVFLLGKKEYSYLDLDDVKPYAFDEKALSRLIVPKETEEVLSKILTADQDTLFGDLLDGKHGGLIVLASGPTGVGKTLTAEVFAEHTKRPLYVLELGELGTRLQELEENLKRVFQRANRWNAVLLLDEADIFMTERGGDLERSAIVGVFLRLLDYYPGTLFLTTNLAQALDPAVRSRVTLHLEYGPLTEEARGRIWRAMLDRAGFSPLGNLQELSELPLNGRQIRSAVRLLRIVKEGGVVTTEEVKRAAGLVLK